MLTRREFGGCALAAPLAAAGSRYAGVTIGIASYSFRDRPLDSAIEAMQRIGLQTCALWQGHVEPRGSREERRKWRCTVSLDEFARVREKFHKAGVALYAYYYDLRDDASDEEIARGFAMAKALGVKYLESSPNRSTVPRIERYAAPAPIRYRSFAATMGTSSRSTSRIAGATRPSSRSERAIPK